ncbi:acyl carrier protein [Desulfoplanes sp.]
MNREQIIATIKEILQTIAPEQDLRALTMDADLTRTLEIDSYDFLNLMIAISKKFGRDIPEETYGRLGTMGNIVLFLEGKK